MTVHRILRAAESARRLDGLSGTAQRVLRTRLSDTAAGRVLRGSWLGHPVHPMLVVVPIGAWFSSVVLELRFGHRDAAQRLVTLGLIATPPAVAAGVADWVELDGRQRRVGLIHAMANSVAAGCFVASHRCRSRNRDTAAKTWSIVGLLALSAGGALGGHLAYAQGAGVSRWQSQD